jgi:hypothetical protein
MKRIGKCFPVNAVTKDQINGLESYLKEFSKLTYSKRFIGIMRATLLLFTL